MTPISPITPPAAKSKNRSPNPPTNTLSSTQMLTKTTQIWQWVKREQGKPDACREHRYNSNQQSGESLIQKLRAITFTFEEEEELTLPDVTGRVGTAFYTERVTKKFYDRFKKNTTHSSNSLMAFPMKRCKSGMPLSCSIA